MIKVKHLIKNNTCKTILLYSILFIAIMGLICWIFIANGKEFIWNNSDGLTQHFVNLRYFRQLLVNFIRTGNLSAFTWNIGLGIDLFSNLNYYITGDIFSYFSILFPTKNVESLYSILIIVRMYFIGISFIAYCKYKKMDIFPTIIGSLMYTFSSFVLYSAVRHPYFSNAVMLFPLLMIGIEKIIKEGKFYFYVILIAVTFISSFYFGYMMSLIIAIYGIALAINTYKEQGIKKICSVLLKTFFYSLLGILISSIIVLPTLIDFFNSERSSTSIQPYSIGYYRNLIYNLTTTKGSYWVYLGVQSLIFISLPIFIKERKKNYPLFWLMIVLILPLLVSNIASIICGFSFPNNRWIYVYSFIFAYISTLFLNNQNKISKKDSTYIAGMVALYLGINLIFEKELNKYIIAQFFVLVILIVVYINKNFIIKKIKNKAIFNNFIVVIFVFGLTTTIHSMYIGNNYISEFIDLNEATYLLNTSRDTIPSFSSAVNYLNEKDKNYYKISRYPLDFENLGLIRNYSSIAHYYSITPNEYKQLNVDLNNPQYFISHGLKEFDYRPKITTLLGVKYHITSNDTRVPYGYSLIKAYEDGTKIYENDYAVPFGVLYTKYITEEDYENLNSLEKENMLLKATVLSSNTNKTNLKYEEKLELSTIEKIKYTISDKYNILNNNSIIITDTSENNIELKIDDLKNKEIYIYFDNLQYQPFSKQELINQKITLNMSKYNINKLNQEYQWYQPDYGYTISITYDGFTNKRTFKNSLTSPYANKFDELLFNLQYHDESNSAIKISFSKIGTYTFDEMKVYVVSMDDYEEDIKELSASNFKTVDYGNGYFEGTVNAEQSGVLQFSTFYNKGFEVYVDGKKAETFKSNKYFLGINIEKGYHTVSIKYHNQYIKYGLIASIIGIIFFIGLILIQQKKSK